MYHGLPCKTLGNNAQLGKLTINNYNWHESIKNLESLSININNDLANTEQKRRTKIFAFIYYLASCIIVPRAEVKDNYSVSSWSYLQSAKRKNNSIDFNKLYDNFFEMPDFPIHLAQNSHTKRN